MGECYAEDIVLLLPPGEVKGHSQVHSGYVPTGAGSDSVSHSRTLDLGGCLLISGVNRDYPVERPSLTDSVCLGVFALLASLRCAGAKKKKS